LEWFAIIPDMKDSGFEFIRKFQLPGMKQVLDASVNESLRLPGRMVYGGSALSPITRPGNQYPTNFCLKENLLPRYSVTLTTLQQIPIT
jgi:hypothetical protein